MNFQGGLHERVKEAVSDLFGGICTPGHYGNKGLEWIGRNTLNAIEKSLLYTKFWQYQSTFEKDHTGDYTAKLQLQSRWLGKKHTMPLSFIKSERKLSRMLQNTLEMTQ
ncbi:hypothetical protein BU17DRAFT_68705 [Hysterangium stoloniferum]|nr:hypothetical protein BU17DRAFT_68705 [Hysterangium stoloniferum]